jgi:hypothetical protein
MSLEFTIIKGKLPEIIFVKDDSLARFKGRNLFPDKVAHVGEDFKNIVLPSH